MRSSIMLLMFILISFGLSAQAITVTGTVAESVNSQPLEYASIIVKGTTKYTMADPSGKYSIDVNIGDTLIFSYAGHETQVVKVEQDMIDVKMEEEKVEDEDLFFHFVKRTVRSAEAITISGTITDSYSNEPIPNVWIAAKGTTSGTTSDINGNYTISTLEGATLVFSLADYEAKEIRVNEPKLDVSLESIR